MAAEGGLVLRVDLALGALRLRAALSSPGPALALVGPSGAGKSTLLRVLAGLERRARGVVAFGGQTWQDSERGTFVPPWKRRAAWVPQDACLFPHLSVRRNLGYAGARAGEVEDVARRLGVAHLLDRMPRHLSGGERQRVALGRALLSGPRLLLLDEPFSALDRPARVRLGQEVAAWCRERDVARVLVSHHEGDVEALGGEVWTVSGGELERSSRSPLPCEAEAATAV